MRRSRNGLAIAAVVLATAGTPNAHAQVSCWQRVIADWSAGRLGPGYLVSCYQSALAHLPDDVRTYSSAPDDIRRAMLGAVEARARHAAVASTPRRAAAVRRPAAVSPARAPRTEAEVAAPSVVAETGARSGGRSMTTVPAVLVAGALVLWLAAGWAHLARRRRRA
jgi:hypothetical protein